MMESSNLIVTISPETPAGHELTQVDMLDLELLLSNISNKLEICNQLLGYILADLIWIIILLVVFMLVKLLYKTFFKRNDFLN